MNDFISNIFNDYDSILKDSIENSNKHIDVILLNKNNEPYIIASDGNESAIEFNTSQYNSNYEYNIIPEWDFNFDYYFYNLLEEDYKIGYISDDLHYGIWNSLNELYPTDIECKEGVKKYIEYCKNNNIDKKYIDAKTGNDTPDIMPKFTIKILYVEPNKLPKEMDILNNLETKQHLVGGYIEPVYLLDDDSVILICNEEGKNNGMQLNRDIGYDIIAGPFLIAGNDEENGDFKSLTESQIEKYKKRFNDKSILKTQDKINAIKIKNNIRFDREDR